MIRFYLSAIPVVALMFVHDVLLKRITAMQARPATLAAVQDYLRLDPFGTRFAVLG